MIILLVLLGVFGLTGCDFSGNLISDAEKHSTDGFPIELKEEFENFLPVHVQTKRKNLYKRIGLPDEQWIGDFPGHWVFYQEGYYANLDILLLEDHTTNGQRDHWVARVKVTAPFSRQSKHGLRIGSHKKEVFKVLGMPVVNKIKATWYEIGFYNWILNADIYYSGDGLAYAFTYDQYDCIEGIEQIMLEYNPAEN